MPVALIQTIKLFNQAIDILLAKGLYISPPIIAPSSEVDLVRRQSFLRGFFGEKRPLLLQEISNLYFGISINNTSKRLMIGFRQTARSKQVRKFMERGIDLASSLITTFSSALNQMDVPTPVAWEFMVTNSTIPPFSDKLMMYHALSLTSAGIINYSAALTTSLRHDLSSIYTKALLKSSNLAEDGINIMIENGWFEEPPISVDRRNLVNQQLH